MRIQAFTPTQTQVFLQIARNYAVDRAVVTDHLGRTFHEMAIPDRAVLEWVQRSLSEEHAPRRDINIKADRAALRARRVVQAMLDEESRGSVVHQRWRALS